MIGPFIDRHEEAAAATIARTIIFRRLDTRNEAAS